MIRSVQLAYTLMSLSTLLNHFFTRCILCIAFLIGSFIPGMMSKAFGQQYMFQINDFRAFDKTINMKGSTELFNDKLRMTSDKPNQTGACWYSAKKIDFTHGFETEFTFLISSDKPSALPGDGFAFVIQAQSPDITGGSGNDIGYKQIPYAVALEFDTKDDHEGSRNHVNLSFYNPETKSYRKYATVHDIPEITDGKPHFTRIIYMDGRLQVYMDSYLFPILSVKLDIGDKVKSADNSAWLGFTASTSDFYSYQDLIAWSIKEFDAEPEDIAPDSVVVMEKGTIQVKDRKLTINVWDHNTIDGDIISLKLGPEWILTEYELTAKKYTFQTTLLGFSQDLILFAHNVGMVPPNTVSVSIFDGQSTQRITLESNMETSESIKIAYTGENE
ncbi:MAG TPA: L-type lectin-domain containing protein [Saprospiraceae bacterium]|nr:L-type lectin-domain containing protein [Saprospiraceae bacterium]